MSGDGGAAPAELLVQAVEGMERPLFVLDPQWCFSYINPAGAKILGRTVDGLVGANVWAEFPEAVDSPFSEHYQRVADTGEPASFEAWFEPLQIWFQVHAFCTDAGLVVTYDDVTARHAVEQAREGATAAREAEAARASLAAAAAELAGHHLMVAIGRRPGGSPSAGSSNAGRRTWTSAGSWSGSC